MKKLTIILLAMVLLVSFVFSAKTVAILTPYLASVTTNTLIKALEEFGENEGWNVTVIDTKGDFGALANRWEDVIAQGVDAIIMGMGDPNQFKKQIAMANEAGIPVFGGDAGYIDGMVCNVTSNNYTLSAQITSYLFDKLEGQGKLVKFYHSAHPGVRKREIVFDAIEESVPDIEIVAEHFVQVPGPIEDARKAMQNILLANPNPGDINAVWAAWDEPAIGAMLAIMEAGRQDEIIVVGIDGNEQALEMIKKGSCIKATVKQDFVAMAQIITDQVKKVFDGEEVTDKIFYAPSILMTKDNIE
jgi:ribose transport system substrate-binding protein